MGLLAVVLALATQAQAPAGVEGVVRGSRDDRPLAYAHVRVIGEAVADWTDADGRYRLEGLPAGRWRLRVAHPAHDSMDLDVLVPAGRDVALDITLRTRAGPAPAPLADFEPFQVAFTLPALLNQDEVAVLIQRLYPSDLMERGVGGESVLRLWLDEQGRVVKGVLSASSGQPALDSLALRVSESMRFRPAKNREDMVRVIVRMPVVFHVPAPEEGRAGGAEAPRQRISGRS